MATDSLKIMKIFSGILFFTIGCLNAQISLNDSRLSDAYTDLTNRINKKSTLNSTLSIKGSPYFDDQFKEAIVVYNGKPLKKKVYLRYNAFSDELELGHSAEQTETDQALIKNSNLHCELAGVVYKYLPLIGGNKKFTWIGYVKEIYKGQHYSLYLRERKAYREPKKARTSLERSFPARFSDEYEWYLQFGDQPLRYIKPNKKSLKSIFKSNSNRLEDFLKENKGDLKNTEYLHRLIRFMDGETDIS